MQKKFLGNLAFLILVNLLVKPFWILGIDREVQNVVGSENYGEYFVLFNLSLLLNIVLDMGITNFNNKNIAQNNQLLSKHLPGIVVLKALLGVVYLCAILLSAFLFKYDAYRFQLLLFLALNQFMVSFILYLRSNVAALHFFKLDAVLSVLDRLLMILLCSYLLWGSSSTYEFNIKHFVYAQSIAYFITLLLAALAVLGKSKLVRIAIDRVFLIAILKKSMPFALLVLLMYFYHRMDTIMLDWMLSEGSLESGIYAQGYRLLDAFNMFTFLTAGILYPLFSKMIKDKEPTQELMRLSFALLFTVSLTASVCSGLYAESIMHLLYTDVSESSAPVFNYLIFASIPISLSYVFGTLLTANGNLKTLNYIALGGVVLNFLLNFFLIPHYGASGSAVATLFTQFTAVGLQVIYVFRYFNYSISLQPIIRLTGFTIGGILLSFLIQQMDADWKLRLLMTAFSFLLLAFLSGFIQPNGIKRLISYRNT